MINLVKDNMIPYGFDKLPILKNRVNKKHNIYDCDEVGLVNYQWNDYGYRASFDYAPLLNEDKIVCIGCSFTEGVGLDEEDTWPNMLASKLGKKYLNLGLSNGSDGYVVWQIMNVLKNVQTENIYVLMPPPGRFFFLNDIMFDNVQSWDIEKPNVSFNKHYEYDRFILKSICEKYSIKYLDCYEFGTIFTKAKDNHHFGLDYQTTITNEFYKLWQKENTYQP